DPDTYLDCLEDIIEKREIISNLFSQEGTGITGWNYMTGILWSLETLAWSEKYLTRVSIVLCELSFMDPGGNWANRPYNSLLNIFLPWIKQTAASIGRKTIALNNIQKEFPDVAWTLFLDLLPSFPGKVLSPNRKPSWRNFIPEDFVQNVSHSEYQQQIESYFTICLGLAKEDINRLMALVDRLEDFQEPYFSNFLNYLKSSDIINKSEAEKSKIWELLEKKVRKHTKFYDAKWALPKQAISEIEDVKNLLTPSNPLHKYAYLFNDYDIELYEEKENFEQQRTMIENRRTNAIKEVYAKNGIHSVIEFVSSIKLPIGVGEALGRSQEIDEDNYLVPEFLNQNEKQLIDFIRGYISTRFQIQEFNWINKFDFTTWNIEHKLHFLEILPFIPQIWVLAKNILSSEYDQYWKNTDASPYLLKPESLPKAVDLLLKFNRPIAAIKVLKWMLHLETPPDIDKIYEALLSDTQKDEKQFLIDPHSVIELVKWLQKQANTNEEILSRIEWIYLRLLDRYSGASPKTLHKALASRPDFYCEVIRTAYRSKNKQTSTKLNEETIALAEQAYYLLQDWTIIPGTQVNGEINETDLKTWLDKVKTICSKSGHLSVALSLVGKVFAHSNEDPSGLFLNKS
ncbi:MAG: hypothetical protein ACC656_04870, partial [Candidatus Heimdallarchaeota archaeon]